MATQKLFLGSIRNEYAPLGNSMSTSYKFDGTNLYIKWKNEIKQVPACLGDAFAIGCNGRIPDINLLGIPKKKEDKLAWILGYAKANRFYSKEEFEKNKEEHYKSFKWWNFETRTIMESENIIIKFCNRSDGGGIHKCVCVVTPKVTDEEIKEAVKKMIEVDRMEYPISYVEAFVKKEFGIKLV